MLGFHVSAHGDLKENLEETEKLLTDYDFRPCAQIFVTGPQSYREIKIANKAAIREISARMPIVIHGAYVDNPWGGDSTKTKGRPNAIRNIKKEMKIAREIGAVGVIVHLGAGAIDDNILRDVITNAADKDITLWLEINAARPAPGLTFETPKKIRELVARIQKAGAGSEERDPTNIGICIDTAHLHSCGVRLHTYDQAMEWLGGLPAMREDGQCGVWSPTYMLHLNDSDSECGSGRDIHAPLGKGNIWGNDVGPKSGLMAFCEWADKYNIMVILERHHDDIPSDLKLLHRMGVFRAK